MQISFTCCTPTIDVQNTTRQIFFSTEVGEFGLLHETLGYDDGELISNFNNGYFGSGPDRGAFEEGQAPMEFGVEAYR